MLGKELTDNIEQIYECLEAMNMQFIYFNMGMLLPVINNKDVSIEKNAHSIFFKLKGQVGCLLPLTKDKNLFFIDIMYYLRRDRELKHIPLMFADGLRKICSVKALQKEHIIDSERLVKMDGRSLASRRTERNKFLKGKNGEFEIVELSKENAQLFLDCNDIWYKKQTEIGDKWRLHDKNEIKWSINNYEELKAMNLGFKTIGFLQNGEIKCFVTGCKLSTDYWSCQTQRRSDLKYSGLGYFMWAKLAEHYSEEFENDGTCYTKGIYRSKQPFTLGIKTSYIVKLK